MCQFNQGNGCFHQEECKAWNNETLDTDFSFNFEKFITIIFQFERADICDNDDVYTCAFMFIKNDVKIWSVILGMRRENKCHWDRGLPVINCPIRVKKMSHTKRYHSAKDRLRSLRIKWKLSFSLVFFDFSRFDWTLNVVVFFTMTLRTT